MIFSKALPEKLRAKSDINLSISDSETKSVIGVVSFSVTLYTLYTVTGPTSELDPLLAPVVEVGLAKALLVLLVPVVVLLVPVVVRVVFVPVLVVTVVLVFVPVLVVMVVLVIVPVLVVRVVLVFVPVLVVRVVLVFVPVLVVAVVVVPVVVVKVVLVFVPVLVVTVVLVPVLLVNVVVVLETEVDVVLLVEDVVLLVEDVEVVVVAVVVEAVVVKVGHEPIPDTSLESTLVTQNVRFAASLASAIPLSETVSAPSRQPSNSQSRALHRLKPIENIRVSLLLLL